MKRSVLFVTFVMGSLAVSGVLAQQRAEKPIGKGLVIQSEVVGVIGCLTPEGNNWVLTKATPVLAKAEAVVDLTPTKAKEAPGGQERYRLIGLMNIFNAEGRKGHKVLVKGLYIEDAKEKRINLTSLISLEPTCS